MFTLVTCLKISKVTLNCIENKGTLFMKLRNSIYETIQA